MLERCARFVGHGSSTFSFFLRERRALLGVPKSTTHLLGHTEQRIFDSAAVAEDLGDFQQRWVELQQAQRPRAHGQQGTRLQRWQQ